MPRLKSAARYKLCRGDLYETAVGWLHRSSEFHPGQRCIVLTPSDSAQAVLGEHYITFRNLRKFSEFMRMPSTTERLVPIEAAINAAGWKLCRAS